MLPEFGQYLPGEKNFIYLTSLRIDYKIHVLLFTYLDEDVNLKLFLS